MEENVGRPGDEAENAWVRQKSYEGISGRLGRPEGVTARRARINLSRQVFE